MPPGDQTLDESLDEAEHPGKGAGATDALSRIPGHALELRLGAGGGGEVYRARRSDGSAVAIKILGERGGDAARRRQRFEREIAALSSLDIDGVIGVVSSGQTADGQPWFSMPLMHGPSLAQVLADRRPLPVAEAVRIVETVARTLARVHAAGHAHRDIKPANILLTTAGEPVLGDFGLVVDFDAGDRMTRTGQMLGTPRYMPIEQVTGRVRDWPRADVYALGVVFAEALGALHERNLETPLSLPDGAPGHLQWIVRQATAPLPSDRYPTATAFADDLQAWREQRLVGPGFVQRFTEWSRQAIRARPGVAIGIATLAGAAVLALGAQVQDTLHDHEREARASAAWADTVDRMAAFEARDQHERAQQHFEAFVDAPANRGTVTLAQVWLTIAAERRAEGDLSGSRKALGQALRTTRDPSIRDTAIPALVELNRAEQNWGALAVLSDSLGVGGVELERDIALGLADLASAIPLLDPDVARLFTPLRQATPLGRDATLVVDIDRDGRDEHLPYKLPDGTFGLEQGHPDYTTRKEEGHVVLLRRDTHEEVARLDVWPRGLVETDGRLFTFHKRRLHEIREGRPEPLDTGRPPLDTYPMGLLAADLDGDGNDELVVSQGPPSGFLIEVFDIEPERLTRRAWSRGGAYAALAALDGPQGARLVAVHAPEQAASALLGEEQPDGGPVRVDVFRLHGDALDRVQQFVVGPDIQCKFTPVRAAGVDLDGDGVDELLAGFHGCGRAGTAVFRQDATEGLVSAGLLGGYAFMGATQADEDPAPELLMRHWELGVEVATLVGVGTEVLAPLPRPPAAVPDGPGWFTALGLHTAAAQAWEDLARTDPDHAAQHLDAAATQWAAAGRVQEAALTATAAVRADSSNATLRDQAIDYAVQALDVDLGLSLATGDAPDERTAWLEGMATPTVQETFDAPLGPKWTVLQPTAVAVDRGRLQLSLATGMGPILEMDLRRVGEGPVGIRLSGGVTRAEWGSGLQVDLSSAGRDSVRFVTLLRARSGSWHPWRYGSATGGCRTRFDVAEVERNDPFQVTMVSAPTEGRMCALAFGAEHDRGGSGPSVPDGPEWTLTFSPLGVPGQLARVELDQIELFGLEPIVRGSTSPEPRPSEPSELAAWIRLDPGMIDEVRERQGPGAAGQAFAAAWVGGAAVHPDDPMVRTALQELPDLDEVDAESRGWLLTTHAEALWAAGQKTAARDALNQARAAGAESDQWRLRTRVEAVAARFAHEDGQQAEVAARFAAAVEVAPDPGLARAVFRAWAPSALPRESKE